eukprot:CAMPEP_0172429564 /NCGR_PEP_ID=MMETSP1064-20121228/50938_1 /TAXON_ID=202472 /ORGANISM="Aulacoseira subarctica , Strain CCAP 1002/5" /LENGTH=196 /DNA_ID=CAMNT_0013175061 /DNA_START=57 /DNA_END=647 /DNA_ORIENTATION=+
MHHIRRHGPTLRISSLTQVPVNFHSTIFNRQTLLSKRLSSAQQNNDAATLVNGIQIPPPPSWSIAELRLSEDRSSTANHVVTYDELEILARRSVIDLKYYRKVYGDNGLNSLRRGVENMIRCLSVVTELMATEKAVVTAAEMYDLPKEVHAPLRPDYSPTQSMNFDKVKAGRLMESVSHKLVEFNGQKYFHIERQQ